MNTVQLLITVAVVALGTMATRFLPFILFPASRPTPKYITYLGRVLPSAVIGLLVVYCLKSVSLTAWPHGLPEVIALFCTAALHYWKRNLLISLSVGTILYMVLVQTVFAAAA